MSATVFINTYAGFVGAFDVPPEFNEFTGAHDMSFGLGLLAHVIHNGEDHLILPCLDTIADAATNLLLYKGYQPEEIGERLKQEWANAQAKHGDMTLDKDTHDDQTRFYALAEEVGETLACLTYDNDQETGHGSRLLDEAIQVVGLAVVWVSRYAEEIREG